MPRKKTTTTKKTVKKVVRKTTQQAGLTLNVYNTAGKVSGKITLSQEIFGQKANPELIAQAVRIYHANQRQGNASTKTRAYVAGSTRKLYRQKGTGRARHGDIKAPIYIGGGVAHGPHPRDFSLKFPKQMKRKALFGALSSKLQEGSILAVTGLEKLEKKTKEMVGVMKNLNLVAKKKTPHVLIVLPDHLENVYLAGRNIAHLDMTRANLLNIYEVLNHDKLLFLKDSFGVLEKTYFKKEETK